MKRVLCEVCHKDITFREEWRQRERLALTEENLVLEKGEGVVLDVFTEPILNKDVYFCSLGCLKKWADRG